jgi:hypothetical protein
MIAAIAKTGRAPGPRAGTMRSAGAADNSLQLPAVAETQQERTVEGDTTTWFRVDWLNELRRLSSLVGPISF